MIPIPYIFLEKVLSKPEEPIHQRLIELIEKLEGGVQRRFARQVGIGAGVIGDILGQRKSKPGFELVSKILQTYPQLRAEWLMRGEGEMLNSEESLKNNFVSEPPTAQLYEEPTPPYTRQETTDNLRVLTVQVGPDGEENIELVPVYAAAGYAAGGFTQPTFLSKLPHFRLPGSAYRNGTFRCFQVHGSSMQGTLQDGDWLICRFVDRWAHDILDNRVYVVVSETDILVKRVLNQLDERGRLTLHSDNPSYDVQYLDWRDLREVWQGVARLTQDLTNTRLDVPVELARHQASIKELFERMEQLESLRNPMAQD